MNVLQTRNVVIAVVVALVAAGALVALQQRERQVTAYFSTSTGLYPGDEVKVLGVAVGKVAAIHPEGKKVRVEMDVDADQRFPRGRMLRSSRPAWSAAVSCRSSPRTPVAPRWRTVRRSR